MSKAAELAALIGSQTALSNRNLIINGAMQVAQRGTSSTSTGYQTTDRYTFSMNNFDNAAFTQAQSTIAPAGFTNSWRIDCTTAETALAADEYSNFLQIIEAQNLQHIQNGSSAAKSVTLSFYVKSNKTGTYAVTIYKNDQTTRQISATYTINSADTWEYKTITYAGDTAGGGIDNNNGSGFNIYWHLAAGTNFTSSDSTSWSNYSNAGFAYGHAVNIFDSTANDWAITGIQLEVGEQATPFEHRSFADELQRCQRYFAVRENTAGSLKYYGQTLQAYGSSSVYGLIADYPVTMRTTPTVSQSGTFGAYTASSANNNMNSSIQNLFASSHAWGTGGWTGDSNLVAGYASVMYANTNAKLMADAEL